MGHLFGGILAVGALDLWWINLGGAAALAVLAGVVSVGVGLWTSLQWNAPAGPCIVVTAAVLFLFSHTWEMLASKG